MDRIMKHLLLPFFAIFLVFSCERNLVRNELIGRALIKDDFSFILNDKIYPSFLQKSQVSRLFPAGKWLKLNTFYSSEDINLPGRADLETDENITDDTRFVFFDGIHDKIRNGRNGFTSIRNRAMTLRGISVNDSIDDVFNAYGKTEWIRDREDKWYSGWLSFKYKYYYETELSGEIQQLYDCIEFEIHDGIVVGIYYHFMNSDEN